MSNAAVYIDQAALVEFDIEEDLAGKFSQILPSVLLLALLPFMVLRWILLNAIFWKNLITFSFMSRALLLQWDCALVPHQVLMMST